MGWLPSVLALSMRKDVYGASVVKGLSPASSLVLCFLKFGFWIRICDDSRADVKDELLIGANGAYE